MSALTALPARTLSRAIRNRDISCVELMTVVLQQIDQLNPSLNAIVNQLPHEQCLSLAAEADQALSNGQYRGWLHGIPFAIKDLSHAAGFATTYGSPLFKDFTPAADDPHVARIRGAGALIIGKTNVPEWGLGGHTDNALFGLTRSGTNPVLGAGGSSGGAASALASHMLPIADGSDMMGSLRTPAAFQEIVGFRPTPGLVPIAPELDPMNLKLVSIGPMGRDVADTAALFSTLTGQQDNWQQDRIRDALSGLTIGWLGDARGHWPTDPGLVTACEQFLNRLDAVGCRIAECEPPADLTTLWTCWVTLRQLALSAGKTIYDDPKQRDQMSVNWRWEITQGAELNPGAIEAAQQTRQEWQASLTTLFDRYDLLALPACQVYPFTAEGGPPSQINGALMDTYHRWLEVSLPASLGGLPTISLPLPSRKPELAAGIQFMASSGRDTELLHIASAIEGLITG